MSAERWTPGPWVAVEAPARDVTLKRAYWAVGQAHPPGKGVGFAFGDTDANAHLIAAAPELYAFVEKVRATIDPAVPGPSGDDYLNDGGMDRIVALVDEAWALLAKARGE